MKKGQKVWYINTLWDKLSEGTLLSAENQSSGLDELPTLSVQGKYGSHRILTSWVFDTKKEGIEGFEKKINNDIKRKQMEIKYLRSQLQGIHRSI